jgi:hypothetical protein
VYILEVKLKIAMQEAEINLGDEFASITQFTFPYSIASSSMKDGNYFNGLHLTTKLHEVASTKC